MQLFKQNENETFLKNKKINSSKIKNKNNNNNNNIKKY